MSAAPPQATPRLRRPAFAKELRATIKAGVTPNVKAYTGPGCWDLAWPPGHRLVIPMDHEYAPEDFDFSDLLGQDVLLFASGDVVLARRVAIRMCSHGARMVALLARSLPSEYYYSASEHA